MFGATSSTSAQQMEEPGFPSQPPRPAPTSHFIPRGYVRLSEPSGASIEVPDDWPTVAKGKLDELARQSGLNTRGRFTRRSELYAYANVMPISGASALLDIQTPSSYRQLQLGTAGKQELRDVGAKMTKDYRGKPSQSGIGIVCDEISYEVAPATKPGDRMMVVKYRESEQVPLGRPQRIWKSMHVYVPRSSGDEVQLTLSYRESDEQFWAPVMERIVASLHY